MLLGLILFGWLGTAVPAHADYEIEPHDGSQLSGYVFADLNIDNIRDPFEAGLADVEVVLTMLSDPNVFISAFSNQSGFYVFSGLDAGVYSITQSALALGARNTCVHVGELRDIGTDEILSEYPGTAMLLDQSQGILPHIEEIELPEEASGTEYNFGQIYLGKAWVTTDPPPITPEGQIPEPASALLVAISGLLLACCRRGQLGLS